MAEVNPNSRYITPDDPRLDYDRSEEPNKASKGDIITFVDRDGTTIICEALEDMTREFVPGTNYCEARFTVGHGKAKLREDEEGYGKSGDLIHVSPADIIDIRPQKS